MVNKGRIHRKKGNFEISFGIQSNQMMKCDEKLGKLIFLERRLKEESMESKITKFGSRFTDKLLSE